MERALGALESGRSLLFPAGMGAVTCVVLTMLPPGGTIALAEGSYYGHKQLFDHLGHWGIDTVEFDQTAAPPGEADLILIEAPSNPMLTMPDLEAAVAHRAPVVCDATLSSPLRLRPLELGCDVALHSATKVLAGHDDLIAGVATVDDDALFDRLHLTRRLAGIVASADTAWLLERGLVTLGLRLDRMESTARSLAEHLARHAAVTTVRYPGFGFLVSFDVADRRGGTPRRDRDRDDRERDEPRRCADETRVTAPVGRRPLPGRAAAAVGRPGTGRRALGRSRAGAHTRVGGRRTDFWSRESARCVTFRPLAIP